MRTKPLTFPTVFRSACCLPFWCLLFGALPLMRGDAAEPAALLPKPAPPAEGNAAPSLAYE